MQHPGYQLRQEIHRSPRSHLYRAVREADGLPVVLKTTAHDAAERLRHEYRILSALELPGVVRAFGFEPCAQGFALVLEDCGAPSLAAQWGAPRTMPLAEFFKLAIACTQVLDKLHAHVVHGALNPHNLLWDPTTETLTLIDFAHAAPLPALGQRPDVTWVGPPAFFAPEQLGRLGGGIDARSDLYALGVTFFWLLTGQLPFEATDAAGWLYCHTTRPPAPPLSVNPQLPAPLGDLVLRLLAKDPADRYQSAEALRRDLAECQGQWLATGAIAPFLLARYDAPRGFQLPQRLYGRQSESRLLLDAFRAAANRPGVVAVCGPAGIGKSALVRNVGRQMRALGAPFAEGKFDQFQRQAPYDAISQALTGLSSRLLTESGERVARLKRDLQDSLGPNARIALDLVPALAPLLGEAPPLAELSPTEEQNRFLDTVGRLISAFATSEHPLVIFLDDLQWSDGAALLMLCRLLEAEDTPPLLFILAFRDEEVDAGHPLTEALARIERLGRLRRLTLAPLDESALFGLVADTLRAEPVAAQALGALLQRRSAGNPFFAGELLRTWHQDGLFRFDRARGGWSWDLTALQQLPGSDDSAAFMRGRLERLTAEARLALRQAACVGDAFTLDLLGASLDQSPDAAAAAIAPAIAAGLLAPIEDGGSRFLHDRIRQAAYAMLAEEERQEAHLRIGRLLRARADAPERDAVAIVQQLNAGRARMTDADERLGLLQLNLTAGRKARASTAYRTACEFTRVALELLPDDAWSAHTELTFEAYKLHAACASLSGAAAEAEACFAELFAHSRDRLERAEVHALRAAQHTYANRMDQAIEEGLRALALLGIRFTAKPGMGRVFAELLRTKAALGARRAEDLDEAPPVRDRLARLQMKVLGDFLVPAYLMGNETLFAATVLRQTTLSLRHGNGEEAVSAYMGYAVLLAGLGDLKGAYAFGRLALRLAERFGVVEGRCRAQVLYALFSHSWSQPWETLEGWFQAAIETGRQTGDFLFMAYAGGFSQLWDPRTDLASAIEEGRRMLALVRQAGYQNALDVASWAQQTRVALCGKTAGPLALGDATFDEAAGLARMQRLHNVSGIAIYWLCKLKLACLARAWDDAWHAFEQAEPVIKALAGSPYMVEFAVYGFQVAAQRAPREGRRLRRFERQVAAWARHCPENFAHHLRLMQAEHARLKGRHAQAIPLYESAIAAAAMTGCAQDEARAQEAAARFFEQAKQARRAGICWRAAHDAYRRWGATAKLRALEAERPELAPAPDPLAHAQLDGSALGLVPQLVESGRLEFATVWKATQAISGEPTIERLLARLLAIVKESAGAQKAILVLYDDRGEASRFAVHAESLDGEAMKLLGGEPLEGHAGLPTPLIHEAIRTRTSVWLEPETAGHAEDASTGTRRARSGLALPLLHQGELLGVLYLENTLLAEAFTPERLPVLQILAGQAAVSLITLRTAERAAYLEAERVIKDLHARELETRVAERTSELRAAYARLLELDRLKTSFLGVVSHELRTPLATIHGFAELLEERVVGELTAEQQDYLRQIKRATMGLKRMVDDLLDFTRAETGNLRLHAEEADLAGLIRETLKSVAPQLRAHGLRLDIQVPDAPAIAALDRGRIAQVLLNLVGNAIKFTPRGGAITVSLGQGDERLRVEVADTGIGIEPAQCARIFDRFYQVDGSLTRRQGGVGLGLAITRLLVDAHGGEIGVESAPGMGSTFWFTLPRHAAEPAKRQNTSPLEG